MENRWKGAWEDPAQTQGAGRPSRQPQDRGLGHPTLRDRYLVEMWVPGDIVSTLLQGHGASRAGFGVAASGGRGGFPAWDAAAGLAPQERQPRATAQRGAHGPCADLAPGRNQGQGRLTANQEPRAPQGTESESGTRLRGEGRGS